MSLIANDALDLAIVNDVPKQKFVTDVCESRHNMNTCEQRDGNQIGVEHCSSNGAELHYRTRTKSIRDLLTANH